MALRRIIIVGGFVACAGTAWPVGDVLAACGSRTVDMKDGHTERMRVCIEVVGDVCDLERMKDDPECLAMAAIATGDGITPTDEDQDNIIAALRADRTTP